MAEPPTKRPRRVDSAAMWETNGKMTRTHSPDSDLDRDRFTRREQPDAKPDSRRESGRDDRRYRSPSRDRKDRRRERSRSRDRRDRDWDRRDTDMNARGPRAREKSRSRDRSYERRGPPPKTDRFRDRSRSPTRSNGRARTPTPPPPSRGPRAERREPPRGRGDEKRPNGMSDVRKPLPPRHQDEMDLDSGAAAAGEDEFDEMMRRSMGFTNFRSTKNTKVPGNNIYGVRKEKKTEYRQYMNRVGGFNRPLSPG